MENNKNKSIIDKFFVGSFLFTGIMGTMTPLQASEDYPNCQVDYQKMTPKQLTIRLFELFKENKLRKEDEQEVKALINEGADISAIDTYNSRSFNGNTVLHKAVQLDNVEIVQFLLQQPKINVNIQDKFYGTPLSEAVHSRREIFELLLKQENIDVNMGRPLHKAVRCNKLHMIKRLLQHPNIDINSYGAGGGTPLHNGIMQGSVEAIQLLLQNSKINVNDDKFDVYDFGGTPLLCAVIRVEPEIVKRLLEHPQVGIDIPSKCGSTPLHWAVAKCIGNASSGKRDIYHHQNVEIIKRLLASGARVDILNISSLKIEEIPETVLDRVKKLVSFEDSEGILSEIKQLVESQSNRQQRTQKLFDLIKNNGTIQDCEKLIQEGVNINARNKDNKNNTLLAEAVCNNCLDIIPLLLKQPLIDINTQNDNGETPLCWAMAQNNLPIVELLLSNEQSKRYINIPDKDGCTPLHWAVFHNQSTVIRRLLEGHFKRLSRPMPIDINIQDCNGNTPLHWATELEFSNNPENVELLLQHPMMKIDIQNNNGDTPLHSAIKSNNLNIVEILLASGARIDIRNLENQTASDLANNTNTKSEITALVNTQIKRQQRTQKLFNLIDNGEFHNGKFQKYKELDNDKFEKCEKLIANGVNINARDKNNKNNTLLLKAVSNGCADIVDLLLQYSGIEINVQNKDGDTPLHLAMRNSISQIVELLLQRPGINVNILNKDGDTPLHVAIRNNKPEIIELFSQHTNIATIIKNDHSYTLTLTLLYAAIEGKNYEIFQYLLQESGINVNAQNGQGNTLLHLAVKERKKDLQSLRIIQCLLQQPEINVNATNGEGDTPLHSAVQTQNLQIVECLLQQPEINVNATTGEGDTPLHLAVKEKERKKDLQSLQQIIQRLLQQPWIDVNATNGEGNTPLHLAVKKREKDLQSPQIIRCLLQQPGINVNATNGEGNTPLHLAMKEKEKNLQIVQCSIVQYLLQDPWINVNAMNGNGDTPLHLAVEKEKNLPIIRYLLRDTRTNVNAMNRNGDTPLHLAVKNNKNLKIVQCLLQEAQGIDVKVVNGNGNTPLQAAESVYSNWQIIRSLGGRRNQR
ncbi:MAG: ankyrin repeat domain-containing protein [Puniceicoccales bacterium]|jgi:cytohesin|nr:ankyrin repeat domain-containing protein [Puniceicoccales bacterium]